MEIVALSYDDAKKVVTGGWQTFEQRYSRCPGIMLLALSALNGEQDQALLYKGNSSGMLCGEDKLLLMMKKDDIGPLRKRLLYRSCNLVRLLSRGLGWRKKRPYFNNL
ncbi:MAG: hypothetical protein HY010_12760 [Acidobacteria bacterium]|nr:hypothetical protein [Acidobacteriota bacterium]